MAANDNTNKILAVVRQIPSGRVATYGTVARLAGIPRNSRQVGSVLKRLPEGVNVPWFRVVNSKGEISDRGRAAMESFQRSILERENVEFDASNRISLKKFGWPSDEE